MSNQVPCFPPFTPHDSIPRLKFCSWHLEGSSRDLENYFLPQHSQTFRIIISPLIWKPNLKLSAEQWPLYFHLDPSSADSVYWGITGQWHSQGTEGISSKDVNILLAKKWWNAHHANWLPLTSLRILHILLNVAASGPAESVLGSVSQTGVMCDMFLW